MNSIIKTTRIINLNLIQKITKKNNWKFVQEQPKQKKEKLTESRDENIVEEQNAQQKPKVQPIRVEAKIGRYDPCPCGSGKKFKSCHGKD